MSRCAVLSCLKVSLDLPVIPTGTQFIDSSKLSNFWPSGNAYLYEQFGEAGV